MIDIDKIALDIAHRNCTKYTHVPVPTYQFSGDHMVQFCTKFLAAVDAARSNETHVGYGLFVEGKCLSIGQHPSSGHVGGKSYKSEPLYRHPAPIPEGYVLVPVEPTEAILDALYEATDANFHDGDLTIAYKSMLEAAEEKP